MKDSLLVNAKSIREGDLVMVCYSMTDGFNNPAKKLDGQKFVVKHIRYIRDKGQRVIRKYYELYDAVSKMGTPYAFLEDELIRL